jgi:hypothetical protein
MAESTGLRPTPTRLRPLRGFRLDGAEEGHEEVEDPRLAAGEVVAPQDAAVQPPAEAAEDVLVVDLLDLEAGVVDHLLERFPRVTPEVADLRIHRPEESLVGGDEKQHAAAGSQEVIQTAERAAIVLDVLEHVEADHGVELILLELSAIVDRWRPRSRRRSQTPSPSAPETPGQLEVRRHADMARDTGATYFIIQKETELPAGYAKLAQELRQQYQLIFYSDASTADIWHPLAVETRGGQQLRIPRGLFRSDSTACQSATKVKGRARARARDLPSESLRPAYRAGTRVGSYRLS